MAEKRIIVLARDVRTFTRATDRYLARTGSFMEKGADIVVDEPQLLYYDHNNKIAFPTIIGHEPLFVLAEEMELNPDEIAWALRTRTAQLDQVHLEMSSHEAELYMMLERGVGMKAH